MELSTYGYIVGALLALIGLAALGAKEPFFGAVQVFPRHSLWARILTAVVLGWTVWILFNMTLGWFEPYKNTIYFLAPVAYFLIVIYLDELLAPRMLGVLLLLTAAPILDAARWHDSPWRLVLTVVVYVWVVWGMVLVLSPYRFRKTIEAWAANDVLFKSIALVLAGVGILLIGLSATLY